ncbi:MAG: hypothetical protein MI921_05925 [Cytophagales bacterium]|nr:hypothetical protein [Cytophagales bacterium]
MKKMVLKVAAVALCMSGFLAVNARNANPAPTCQNQDPIAVGAVEAGDQMQITRCKTSSPNVSDECPMPFEVIYCQITSGPGQGIYLGPIL